MAIFSHPAYDPPSSGRKSRNMADPANPSSVPRTPPPPARDWTELPTHPLCMDVPTMLLQEVPVHGSLPL
eukprot:6327505-Amphidinium_carterae.1